MTTYVAYDTNAIRLTSPAPDQLPNASNMSLFISASIAAAYTTPIVLCKERELTFGANLSAKWALKKVYDSLVYCSHHRKFDVSISVTNAEGIMVFGDSFGHYDREELKTFLQELNTVDSNTYHFATFSFFDKVLFSQVKSHLEF